MKVALVFGAVLFVPAALVTVVAAGGGHGSYFPAKLLFPYTVLIAANAPAISFLAFVAAIAQFPLYALVIERFKKLGWLAIAICHAAAATLVLSLKPYSFTP